MAAHNDGSLPLYTPTEVATHQSKQSLWGFIEGRESVHDVINFHDDSAGGADAFQDVVGSDGTEAFEYAGHSADAVQNLEGLTFGVFADSHILDETGFQATHSVGSGSQSKVFATGLLFVALSAGDMKTLGKKYGNDEGAQSRSSMDELAWVKVFMLAVAVLVLVAVLPYRWIVRLFTRRKDVWEYPAYFPTRNDPGV
ncbi:hypothetical protein MGG_09599 [Pyricularia oryzae 70-15]|uniref:Cytochrome b5 heme-binding domain-containing protein n=1 Tax=Pyricularia oryzae (strain 70-15 / ATCC MYA-4617 / FGSC 8958) TaxID=242507 RepID=G4NLE7_PYRO7|nr:uncharacterized protein MGG_09599 [Pyricularia oryzae 70-15]EHA46748.1 hypothetical protein MGG_09599 [Pyricularia oryzae 70-15]